MKIFLEILGVFASDRKRVVLMFFCVAFLLFILGNWSHSLWDRDESRYAATSASMVESGDWVVPRINGEGRYHKPIMIYWLMSISMLLFGVNEFAVRFASSLSGGITVVLIYQLAKRLKCSSRGAAIAALIAMMNAMLFAISKAATTDALLVLTVVAALYIHLVQTQNGFSLLRHFLFWAIIALSLLTKGPPGILYIFLTILFLKFSEIPMNSYLRGKIVKDKMFLKLGILTPSKLYAELKKLIKKSEFKTFFLRNITGFIFCLIICFPWAYLIAVKTNFEFFNVAIGKHIVQRSTTSFEGHSGIFLYYLPVLIFGMFPFIAPEILAFRFILYKRSTFEGRFILSWIIPGVIVFSFIQTKLPHYVAPVFPALAIMIGMMWTYYEYSKKHRAEIESIAPFWWKSGYIIVSIIGIIGGIAIPAAVFYIKMNALIIPGILAGIILMFSMVAGSVKWKKKMPGAAMIMWSSGMAALIFVGMFWILPMLQPYLISKNMMQWLKENAPKSTTLIASKYTEPSLYFYWGKKITEISDTKPHLIFKELEKKQPTAVLTLGKTWEKWQEQYKGALPENVKVIKESRFFIIERGQWKDVVIIANW